MISGGLIGEGDRVSKDGSEASEYYLFDELVDLWDVESATFDIGGDPRDDGPILASIRTASSPPPVPSRQPAPQSPQEEDEGSTSNLGVRAAQDVLTASLGVESGEPLPAETAALLDDIASMLEFEIADLGSAPAAPPVQPVSPAPLPAPPGFAGYDALSDDLLDPVTIRDLLFDASLYTALAVSYEATEQELNEAYLTRAELIAQRQRVMTTKDIDQVAALEDIRRLIFQSFEFLRNDAKRTAYDRAGQRSGSFKPSAQELGLTRMDPDSQEFRTTGTFSSASRMALKNRTKGDITQRLKQFTTASLPQVNRSRLSGSMPALRSIDDPLLGQNAGPRVYTAPHKALESGELSTIGLSDAKLFKGEVPTDAREREERSKTSDKPRAHRRTFEALDITGEQDAVQWGSLSHQRGTGFLQAALLTVGLCLISIVVVLTTELGANEFDYNGPTEWFYGRNGLLIVGAILALIALRKESPIALGFRPAILFSILAVMIGVALGFVGSFVAPIRIAEPKPLLIMGVILLQAVAHETYFRGFVTRVLLLEMKSPMVAVFTSCFFYGVFYLTFRNVMVQEGFWRIYYSLLLYGFGLGGVYGWLYYKSKSVWPSFLAHFLTIMVTFLTSRVA